jgi:hypothetical protein
VHVRRGHHVALVADAHEHAVGHGEGERQAHGEGGPLPRGARDVDAPAHALQLAAHHVHADAAAAQVGHHLGGREARREDERVHLGVAHPAVALDEAALDGLAGDALAVEAAAVVGELDDDGAAGVARARRTRPRRGLPAAARASGGSRPWSSALRSMWTSGSPRPSATARSISVSSPR